MEITEAVLPDDADEIGAFVTERSPLTDRTILRTELVPGTARFLRVLLARETAGALAGVAVGRAAASLPGGAMLTMIWVRVDLAGRGLASRLFDALTGDLADDVTRMVTAVFSDDEVSSAVARHWGFEPVGLSVTTSLDVSGASAPEPVDDVRLETCDDLRFDDEQAVESMLLASQTNPEVELGLVLSLTSLRETPAPGQRPVAVLGRVDGRPAAISFAVADGDQMHVIYTGRSGSTGEGARPPDQGAPPRPCPRPGSPHRVHGQRRGEPGHPTRQRPARLHVAQRDVVDDAPASLTASDRFKA